ncbi:tRNA (adenosine(37)-N6)-dimethylallyltransferase MiaA [Candidatus Uhrbacteria bacterium]|nr:tRNA (adenosine(37)-N6)-dimethylallyltransferase MiaA [Candidatus Uhrbacteria bacterium]
MKPKLVVIVGPTASGKSDLAIAVAKKFGGEIISADSRQLYRGLEIGAAIEPGRWTKRGAKRVYAARGVAHHLTAFRSPAKPLTAAEYKKSALSAIGDILKRGKLPILVGGTGLYVNAVVDNFSIPEVAPDPALRQRLEKLSSPALYARLQKKDPIYAAKIPPQNRRYMIRALEVIQTTGRPFSELQKKGEPLFTTLLLGVERPRVELYRRIERRVDAMMKRGLLQEAKKLGRLYGWSNQVLSSLGHRQLGLALQGKIPLEEAVLMVKRDTRRYAKRQMGWFRRDARIIWLKSSQEAEKLVKRFLVNTE